MEGFINVREEPISEEELKRQIIHDYRLRSNLDNVDYSKINDNIFWKSANDLRGIISKVNQQHKNLYKKKYRRSIDPSRTRSHIRGVITFPAKYQKYYEQGKFDNKKLLEMFKDFIEKYKQLTGKTIYNFVLHAKDEKTLHFHFYATNFDEECRTRPKAGRGAALQDIAGESFKPIGLRRGIPKASRGVDHKKSRDHYNEIMQQSEIIEERLKADEITAEEVQDLADFATKPLKTMLIYIKRALDLTAEAEKIKKNQDRAMAKMKQALPQVKDLNDFDELINYITNNKQQLKTKNFTPKQGG